MTPATALRLLALFWALLFFAVPAHASPAERALSRLCPHAMHLAPLVEQASRRHMVHPAQLVAVVASESHCDDVAENARTGARGLGQILPNGSAARGYEPFHLWDAATNLDATARHLARLSVWCGCFGGVVRVYHGHRSPKGWRHDRHVQRVLALLARCYHG